MKTITGNISQDELKEMAKNKSQHFATNISFLQEINGLRRGNLHVFMGVPSGGKTTLVRTIILDFIKNNNFYNGNVTQDAFNRPHFEPTPKMAIYLSEENSKDYLLDIIDAGKKLEITKENDPKMDELIILSELEQDVRSFEQIIKLFESKPALLIIDNITTSLLYGDRKPSDQQAYISEVKRLAIVHNVAVILIAHTRADINKNNNSIVNMNDIRGSKGIVNFAEYFFVMQRFTVSTDTSTNYYPLVYIEKHRGCEIQNNFFSMSFDSYSRTYKSVQPIPFSRLKEIFKVRDKL